MRSERVSVPLPRFRLTDLQGRPMSWDELHRRNEEWHAREREAGRERRVRRVYRALEPGKPPVLTTRRTLTRKQREVARRVFVWVEAVNSVPEGTLAKGSRSRLEHVQDARQQAVLALYELYGWSLPEIAAALRKRDHTTALYHLEHARRRRNEPEFVYAMEELAPERMGYAS